MAAGRVWTASSPHFKASPPDTVQPVRNCCNLQSVASWGVLTKATMTVTKLSYEEERALIMERNQRKLGALAMLPRLLTESAVMFTPFPHPPRSPAGRCAWPSVEHRYSSGLLSG